MQILVLRYYLDRIRGFAATASPSVRCETEKKPRHRDHPHAQLCTSCTTVSGIIKKKDTKNPDFLASRSLTDLFGNISHHKLTEYLFRYNPLQIH